MSIRDKIIAADDLRKERVEVPEWDVTVFISTMTSTERDAWESEQFTFNQTPEGQTEVTQNKENIRARLLVRTLLDENGDRVFSDEDATELGKKSPNVVGRLFSVAQRLNFLTDKDVDSLAKNS